MKKLVLPDSLETIGNEAFYGGKEIEEIVWPENSKIKSIGNGAFNWCKALKEVAIPSDVETMGLGVFANCVSLQKVSGLPEKYIKDVPQSMFGKCPLVVKENPWLMDMETIGVGAFGEAFAEGEVLDLSETQLTSIAQGAFSYSKLGEVILPDTLESVGLQAFFKTPSLKKVTLPATNTQYDKEVFRASALEEVVIPDGCTTIGEKMFYKCSSLTSIGTLPGTLTTIGAEAFRGTKLTNVFIPKNVTTIGNNAFRDIENIRCAASAKPEGWVDGWCNKTKTVTWNATK